MSENASRRASRQRVGAERLEAMPPEELADHLEAMPEEAIDHSEIPPLDDEFFRTAELLMPRRKRAISLRLDTDLLEWLRTKPRYQSRVNAVLRAYKEAESLRRRLDTDPRRTRKRARPTPAEALLEQAKRLRKLADRLVKQSRESGNIRREDLSELHALVEALVKDTNQHARPPTAVDDTP